jgi:N-formylglutamate deformylase
MGSFVTIKQGKSPLLVSVPHAGTNVPVEIEGGLVSQKWAIGDTDWFMDRIYAFVLKLDATMIVTAISRTAIDVNRDPSGASLYPGQTTTGLVPIETFDGAQLYKSGAEPDSAEIARRKVAYFDPYHAGLEGEIRRLRSIHPRIALYDCHSIRSVVPRLFDGQLPAFNIGTNNGASADSELVGLVTQHCVGTGETVVVDGRFRGGWITRNYGRPDEGVHAIQMEMAQRIYMDEAQPNVFQPQRAAHATKQLRPVLASILDWIVRQ